MYRIIDRSLHTGAVHRESGNEAAAHYAFVRTLVFVGEQDLIVGINIIINGSIMEDNFMTKYIVVEVYRGLSFGCNITRNDDGIVIFLTALSLNFDIRRT